MDFIKILQFVSGINSGGVEQFLINYSSILNKKPDVSQVIAYQHEPDQGCYKKLENAGNKCIRIHDKKKHPVKNIIDTFCLIRQERPDIIHANMNLLNFVPLCCGLICGVKVRISHSHIAFRNIGSPFAEKIFKILNLIFSNELLACGYKAGKYMYGNRKFRVIHNSIDLKTFSFDNNKRIGIRNILGISSDEILVGNVGRLTNQKNQIFLIDVMREIVSVNHKFKLLILGNGELEKTLKNAIKLNKLENNVIIHSSVTNIDEYYDAMDVFALPSLYEGFPVSLVEVQANGLNSLVSNTVDKTAKLNQNVTFLDYNNIELWKDSILKQKFGSRKVDKDRFSEFNINNSSLSLYKLYKKMIGE